MQKKAGRPTDSPKSITVPVRMDAETFEILEKCKKISGYNGSEVIRKGIRYFYDIAALSADNNMDGYMEKIKQKTESEIDPIQEVLNNLEDSIKLIKKIKK